MSVNATEEIFFMNSVQLIICTTSRCGEPNAGNKKRACGPEGNTAVTRITRRT